MKKKLSKYFVLLSFMLLVLPVVNAVAEVKLAPPVQAPDKIADSDHDVMFDKIGIIESYGDGLITIDGKNLKMASSYSVRFFDSDSFKAIVLKVGMIVGYTVDETNRVNAVWVIKPEDRSKALELLDKKKLKE